MPSEMFRPDPEMPGEWAIDVDLAEMTMQASQSPVLVRRDPLGQWWVFIQGPPGVFHGHWFGDEQVIDETGVHASAWAAAITCADEHAVPWRIQQIRDATEGRLLTEVPSDTPDKLRRLAARMEDLMRRGDHE